ncbi:MAG: hypothetical protein ABJI10_15895 [Ekhidna sp.]
MSRKAQHTVAAVFVDNYSEKFQSGDGWHAEDRAVSAVRNYLQNINPANVLTQKNVTLYVSKSPCYGGDADNNATFVPKAGGSKKVSCTNVLNTLNGQIINGYKVHLKVKVWRIYHGKKVKKAEQSSIHSMAILAKDGASVDGISSNNSVLGGISNTSSARTWRKKQRQKIQQAVKKGKLLRHKKAKKA